MYCTKKSRSIPERARRERRLLVLPVAVCATWARSVLRHWLGGKAIGDGGLSPRLSHTHMVGDWKARENTRYSCTNTSQAPSPSKKQKPTLSSPRFCRHKS